MADLISMLAAVAGSGGGADPNFNQTVLLLHGDGTNGAQNNTFLDSSSNNFTITRNSNTTQGTFSPFSVGAGEWSNYFDGTGDFLESSDNAAFELGSGDFTIESWFYTTNLTNSNTIFAKWAASNQSYIFQILSSGTAIRFAYSTDGVGSTIRDYSATINTNEWYHVAVCRASGDTKVFLNGTQVGSTTSDNVTFYNGTSSVSIGKNQASGTTLFFGYLSNVRLVKSAVYTSNFTVPTAPLTAISNTSLLTCQSNRFVDNSTNAFAITSNGDVKVTPFSPFAPTAAYSAGTNGGSGYFDGTGDYLTAPDDNAWSFAGDFTVEAWAYPISFAAERCVIAHWYGGSNAATSLNINFASSTGNVVAILAIGSTQYTLTSASAYPAGCWHHIALVRSGSTVTLYVNGASAATTTASGTTNNLAHPLSIGALNALGSYIVPFLGYIAGVRILNGSAQVPPAGGPTTPPTSITNTSLLCNFTNAGIIDNTGKNVLETVGNAQIDTTTKKYGTGSMEFDGTGDNLLIPSSPDFDFGTGAFTVEMWVYFNALSSNRVLIDRFVSGNSGSWQLYWRSTGTSLTWFVGSAIVLQDSNASRITTNQWYHIALARSGTTVKLFVDGTEAASATNSASLSPPSPVAIGFQQSNSTNYLNGFIDDLRITKGVARYDSNFTPPTAAFPDL